MSNISSLVNANPVNPFILAANLRSSRSSQPHLLGLPVVAPNSAPSFLSLFPMPFLSSVGKGPSPTRVVYAFATPITFLIFCGATPAYPVTPPDKIVLAVTKG